MNDIPTRYLDGFLAAVSAPVAPTPSVELPPAEEPAKPRPPHPLDSFPRLLDCARHDRPPGAADRECFQWFGLFYQAPEQDAFLLRLRLPGGRLKAFQLAGLAEITQECGGGHVLLNAQGGLDVPGVPVRAAAGILRRVEGIGLSARQTGGNCVQAVRGGEREGLAGDARLPGIYPLVCTLEQALANDRALADLPRPCEIIFRAAGETVNATLPDRIELAQTASGFLDGAGRSLTADQVVPACLEMLAAWAARGGRLEDSGGGPGLRPPGGRAQQTEPAPCLAVPGKRLLSGQLAFMAGNVQAGAPGEIRLADGQVLADTATLQSLRGTPGFA